jgi:transcriptional regulator with XRE-family HTH domain
MRDTINEYRQIAAALHRVMKGRKITFDELGKRLGISSRTAKRMIHGDDYSISKIAEVCEAIGIRFFDLMQLAHEEHEASFEMTLEQEEYFATSPKHYRFFQLIKRGVSLVDLRKEHKLTKKDTDRYLRDIEKVGLLERYPDEKFKIKVRGGHNFISKGPLEKTIARKDTERFMNAIYGENKELKSYSTSSGTAVSAKTIEGFLKEAEALAAKYRLIGQRERSLLPAKDLIRVRWMIGIVYPFDTWIQEIPL